VRHLDWHDLARREIPPRSWIIDHWLGCGHVTLLAGRGGIGKSLLAQQIGSAVAIGTPYIDAIPTPRTVLYWAAEDDPDELWRRQSAIAAHMKLPLEAFADRLYIESFADRDCTLATTTYGALTYTPMIGVLEQQIGDYRADLVILDNIARLFGGNENSRHDVTVFIAALVGAAAGRAAGILLLGHNSRVPGSEFSGSSAWENSVRSRLWFDDRPPDQPKTENEDPDPDLRYLARRKANYTARDLRTMHYREGVFVADAAEGGGSGLLDHIRRGKADRVTVEAFRKLIGMGQAPSDGASSPNNLPKLVMDYKLSEGLTRREITDAMRRLMTEGRFKRQQIGVYANRSPRYGLTEAQCTN
jgi:RecA-family ATPase